jgi:probable phosphoglycerate mutase
MVSSPLGRARRTASIICDVQGRDASELATDDRLKEISWGDWEGLTRGEIDARNPGELARRRLNRWRYVPPGGESYEMLSARVRGWISEISPEQRLVVVGHGGMGRVLRGLYAKLPIPEILTLDRPQDAIFRLHCGEVARIEVGPTV